jgi:hypothetical protein
MTSRTIDIHCKTCRRYLCSLQPRASLAELRQDRFCSKKCEENPPPESVKVETPLTKQMEELLPLWLGNMK